MNLQEQFDFVVTNLRKQGTQSFVMKNNKHLCMYRGSDGKKCAAGWLIPDEVYTEDMEYMGWKEIVDKFCDVLPNYLKTAESLAMVKKLQLIHDDDYMDYDKELFEKLLEEVAEKFGLKYTPPEATQ